MLARMRMGLPIPSADPKAIKQFFFPAVYFATAGLETGQVSRVAALGYQPVKLGPNDPTMAWPVEILYQDPICAQ